MMASRSVSRLTAVVPAAFPRERSGEWQGLTVHGGGSVPELHRLPKPAHAGHRNASFDDVAAA
jgi:hypothetical protein